MKQEQNEIRPFGKSSLCRDWQRFLPNLADLAQVRLAKMAAVFVAGFRLRAHSSQ